MQTTTGETETLFAENTRIIFVDNYWLTMSPSVKMGIVEVFIIVMLIKLILLIMVLVVMKLN